MEVISITPSSPLCRTFETDEMVSFAWISDLIGCNFNGILDEGELASRIAWQLDPPWCPEKGVVGIVTVETLPKFRKRGYARALVDFVRSKYPNLPVVFELNTPWAYQFWKRYDPDCLGRGRGISMLMKLLPMG
jgi:predicted acetyltransferase